MRYRGIKKEEWDKTLEQLLLSYTIFANVENEFGIDYELISMRILKGSHITHQNLQLLLKGFFSLSGKMLHLKKLMKNPGSFWVYPTAILKDCRCWMRFILIMNSVTFITGNGGKILS